MNKHRLKHYQQHFVKKKPYFICKSKGYIHMMKRRNFASATDEAYFREAFIFFFGGGGEGGDLRLSLK